VYQKRCKAGQRGRDKSVRQQTCREESVKRGKCVGTNV